MAAKSRKADLPAIWARCASKGAGWDYYCMMDEREPTCPAQFGERLRTEVQRRRLDTAARRNVGRHWRGSRTSEDGRIFDDDAQNQIIAELQKCSMYQQRNWQRAILLLSTNHIPDRTVARGLNSQGARIVVGTFSLLAKREDAPRYRRPDG